MAELANAFEQTNILSGRANVYLNVLQVQRLLESNIPDCQVHLVIVKQNCTLIRLTANGQQFDFAVAPNTVACKSTAGNLSIDYNGILTETILTIVNEFKPNSATDSATTGKSDVSYTTDCIISLIFCVINTNREKYVAFKEITSRGYWKGVAQKVIGRLGNVDCTDEQLKSIIVNVLDSELQKIR